MNRWISKTSRIQFFDILNRELIRITVQSSSKKEYDLYMKVYWDNLMKDKVHLNRSENIVIGCIAKQLRFESIEVFIGPATIKRWASDTDLSKQAVYTAIQGLDEKKVLIKMPDETYILNPIYYYMGTENARFKAITELKDTLEE